MSDEKTSTTVLTNLPVNDLGYSYVFALSKYKVFGIASNNSTSLYIDNESVTIKPVTFTWEKEFIAPSTGQPTIITHQIALFGINSSNIFDASDIRRQINILVLPLCS